jgi:hypothetical protein
MRPNWKWIAALVLWCAIAPAQTRISELPAAGSAAVGDEIPANQSGTTRKLTAAQIAALEGPITYCTSATGTDTYVGTCTPTLTAYGANLLVKVLFSGAANTGAATLDLDTVGALAIYKHTDGTELADNDIRQNVPVVLAYCAACNSAAGAWMLRELGNAPAGAVGTDAVGTGELDDDANTPTAGDFVVVETGDASFDYLTPNAGTDITADLEEETHASEHLENAADELAVEGLGTACTTGQLFASDGSGGVDCTGGGTFNLSRWQQCFTLFDAAADLTTSVDIPSIWRFTDDYGLAVDKIDCETDANTASINFQRDDGTAANLLSGSLVCDTGGQTSCASGCDVNTIEAAEDNFSVGDKLDFLTVAIDAGVRRVNVCVSGVKE